MVKLSPKILASEKKKRRKSHEQTEPKRKPVVFVAAPMKYSARKVCFVLVSAGSVMLVFFSRRGGDRLARILDS